MKTVLIVALFACLATTGAAQSNMEQTQAGSGGDLFGPGLLFPDHHFGGFSFFGNSFGHGMFGRSLFHRSLFLGPQRRFSFGGPYQRDFLFGAGYGSGMYPWWGYGQFGPQPALYSSQTFVEQWKDYNPLQQGSQKTQLQQSILLSEGMTEEQVLGAVGSPIQKVTLGERTVWKYSGYSLLFEGGSLKEIR